MERSVTGQTLGQVYPRGHYGSRTDSLSIIERELVLLIAGVPGEKPQVTSDKLPDSCSKFPCIQL